MISTDSEKETKAEMVPTPFNSAGKEDFAKVVLMPGDPLRSKWIAEEFFEAPRLVNNIRGAQGYTGTWHGHPVSVMASGMGIPSLGIYAYELYNFYDTDIIIRTGTAGSISKDVNIGDLVIPERAFTTSSFAEMMGLPRSTEHVPDRELFDMAVRKAKETVIDRKVHTGPVLTEDLYYGQDASVEKWSGQGVIAFEMEAAALFEIARAAGKKALAVLTISNSIIDGTQMRPDDTAHFLAEMIETALKAAFDE